MKMEKFFIQNRKGQKVCVLLEKAESPKGLAFVMHGLGGFKEQDHIEVFAAAFRKHGFAVVRFDTADTLGESEGNYENATITSYYEDLEDVIKWAKSQDWYQEPFVLSGHSLGGICILLYAEQYPEEIKGLLPVSSYLSHELYQKAKAEHDPDQLKEWEETGWRIEESVSKPGVTKKLNWHQFTTDAKQYDIFSNARKLTMPALLLVGSGDWGTPPKNQQLLLDSIPEGKKELVVIKGAKHNFREEGVLREVGDVFDQWIKKYLV